jgi:hypothetical protein
VLPLAERVLDAYGGPDRWRAARAVRCTVTAWGFAFLAKMRGGVRDLQVEAEFPHPRVVSWSDRNAGVQRIFDGTSVRVENAAGETVASRADPRRGFPYGRRLFYWDRLDEVYFSSYAIWNYVTFAALLLRDDIEWTAPAENTLEAHFPPGLPTHSAVQQFHFDAETSLLRQHDYTAEVFGNWATAANVVLTHAESDGIPYPSHRRVTPRKANGTPRGFPLLVDIRIRDWRLA